MQYLFKMSINKLILPVLFGMFNLTLLFVTILFSSSDGNIMFTDFVGDFCDWSNKKNILSNTKKSEFFLFCFKKSRFSNYLN